MKNLSTLLFVAAITSNAYAQKPDQLLARANYTYINKQDTLKTGQTRTENMILFLGKNTALYTSYDKIKYELSEDQKSRARAMNRAGSGGAPMAIKIDKSAGDWLTQTNYLSYFKEKKLFTKEMIIGFGYLIEEPLSEIKWKVTKDTATFSGLACQKATTNYEGQNWTVWFAPSLPFQSGPWKLQGLPGLIINAANDQQTIQFQFTGFDKANENDFVRANDVRKNAGSASGTINSVDALLGLDVAGAYFDNNIQITNYQVVKTNRKDFEKLKTAFKKDPKGFLRTQMGF